MIDLIRDFPFSDTRLQDTGRRGIPRGRRYLRGHAHDVGGQDTHRDNAESRVD